MLLCCSLMLCIVISDQFLLFIYGIIIFLVFFLAFTFKAPSLLKTKAVPNRVAFSKHGIAIGIFSFFICFSKFFLMVKNASIIIGTTSAFLFQSFWISVISCVTSGFLFFNLVFWNRFVWLLYLFFRHFLLFYWHVCICIWSYSFLGLKFHSDLSPPVYVTASGMWLFHLLLRSKWHLLHKFSEPFVLILPCL